MRFKLREPQRRDVWHPWFAWYPVMASGHIVWLETIERCLIAAFMDAFYSYRLPSEPKTHKHKFEVVHRDDAVSLERCKICGIYVGHGNQ